MSNKQEGRSKSTKKHRYPTTAQEILMQIRRDNPFMGEPKGLKPPLYLNKHVPEERRRRDDKDRIMLPFIKPAISPYESHLGGVTTKRDAFAHIKPKYLEETNNLIMLSRPTNNYVVILVSNVVRYWPWKQSPARSSGTCKEELVEKLQGLV